MRLQVRFYEALGAAARCSRVACVAAQYSSCKSVALGGKFCSKVTARCAQSVMLGRGLARVPSLAKWFPAACQWRGVKESTYLKGLEVDAQAEKNTPLALRDLLERVQNYVPDGVAYRAHVEKYCNRFLQVISESPTQADAEETLGRQFEEIQADAAEEMELVTLMATWKPWEVDSDKGPALFAEMKDMPTNVKAFREFQHDLSFK